jgi:hypothetical protein
MMLDLAGVRVYVCRSIVAKAKKKSRRNALLLNGLEKNKREDGDLQIFPYQE